jgi:glutamate racemase
LIATKQRSSRAPVGVFDSGVGGLTVLRALKATLPNESFVYLGDTARLPYGTKSPESITRYSLQATRRLVEAEIKCLVVACNTASAVAINELREQFAPLPVIGVLEPGAEAACRASISGRIAVIGTDSTIRGGAYQRAILARSPDAKISARACPIFVALAEEGWNSGHIVTAVAHRYLDELFDGAEQPDTLVLGCTHFPVLADALREVVGNDVRIVDSAQTTAIALGEILQTTGLAHAANSRPSLRLLATDGRERFARVGAGFLGQPINTAEIELVDLAETGKS